MHLEPDATSRPASAPDAPASASVNRALFACRSELQRALRDSVPIEGLRGSMRDLRAAGRGDQLPPDRLRRELERMLRWVPDLHDLPTDERRSIVDAVMAVANQEFLSHPDD